MFSRQFYLVIHIVGIVLAMSAIGAATMHNVQSAGASRPTKRLINILHGLGMFAILLGGFGMLARLGVMHGAGFPLWVWAKLGIWLAAGAAVAIPYKKPEAAKHVLIALPVLAGLATYLAVYKPF